MTSCAADAPFTNPCFLVAWRKVLKDLVTYFREIQASYDHRAKNLLKISNVINNTISPPIFLQSGGLNDAVEVLRNYHKLAVAEANKSKDIENDVILALVGLRSDLNQKIKEIKNLSGDFKNSVDKEMENTRKAVNELQECLGQTEIDPSSTTGKKDPYLLKLAVDRQVERQIDEENYLHQVSKEYHLFMPQTWPPLVPPRVLYLFEGVHSAAAFLFIPGK